MKKVLALVDHSVYAPSVCDHAAWLAGEFGAAIDVLHVVDPFDLKAARAGMAGLTVGGPGLVGNIARHSEARIAELIQQGQELVDSMTSRLAASEAEIRPGRVVVGELPDVLKTLGADTDILVAGKRGEDADFVNLSLGSSLERIIRAIDTPLLIAPRVFRPIVGWVLAFGTGPEVASGLRHITQDRLLPPLPCEIVYVGEPDENVKSEIEAASALLSDVGFPVRVDVVDGRPVQILAKRMVSDETRLIAIGGFNRFRLFPAIFGDGIGTELTKASLAPVLLLR